MTDFGTDLDFGEDLDALGRDVEGVTLLAQALWRMLRTDQGALLDDDEYGFNVVGMLSKPLTTTERATLPSRLRAAVLRDPRVAQVEVELIESAPGAWLIRLRLTPSEGPTFDLVASVANATAQLIEVQVSQ